MPASNSTAAAMRRMVEALSLNRWPNDVCAKATII